MAVLAATAGCSGDAPGSAGLPAVVATTAVWADVVANVACDGLAEVTLVVPIGADPHVFEASLADRAMLERAALVVANGEALEEALGDTLAAVEAGGTPVFRMSEHVDLLASSDDGVADPHIWFDPVRVSGALPDLADELVAAAGLDPAAVDRCVLSYQEELARLHADVTDRLASVPDDRRQLVTNHDALGYFADRYGFTIVGTVIPGPSSLAETSPARLQDLVELVEELGVTAIFSETQHSGDDLEALVDRLGGVEVVTLTTGTLGPAADHTGTYMGMIRENVGLIADALDPGGP